MGQRKGNYVGTSLRGCVRDIVDRNHPIERVDRILSRISFSSREEMIAYVTAGKLVQKDRMADVAGRLWDNGKIVVVKDDGSEEGLFGDGRELWVPTDRVRTPLPNLF
jgi:hypothetical protein